LEHSNPLHSAPQAVILQKDPGAGCSIVIQYILSGPEIASIIHRNRIDAFPASVVHVPCNTPLAGKIRWAVMVDCVAGI
jgi:hypothetical protein